MSASAPPSDEASISERVVEAVAEAKDVDPVEVTPPLNDVVDPEALDRLFESSAGNKQFVFSYDGHEVAVGAEGEVLVYTDTVV